MILREVTVIACPDSAPSIASEYRWSDTQPIAHLQSAITEIQAWIDRKTKEASDPTKAAQPIPTEDV